MRWRLAVGGLALLGAAVAGAEPVVAGYDRFHATQPAALGGRLLFNELGCANCHGGDTGLPARRGPDLKTATARAKADWLRAFIADPARSHIGTTMPQVMEGRDVSDAEDVVHYLGSLTPRVTGRPRPMRHINAERGKTLFHTRGCVACHAPRDDYQPPDGRPAAAEFTHRAKAFPALTEKYVLGTLAEFLRDPLKVRPDGRMPRTEMDEQDSLDLASYLLGLPGSDGEAMPKLDSFTVDKARAERGRGVVAALRCASCHELPANVAVQPVALRGTTEGCLSPQPVAGVPRYALTDGQRRALRAYLGERDRPLDVTQRTALTLEALNCAACHERGGHGGPDTARKAYFQGDHNLGDTGKYPPPLTDVGRKLQPEWLARVLKGQGRVRPYLQTAMPIYGTATDGLPALLAQADARTERTLPAGDLEAGRKLLGTHAILVGFPAGVHLAYDGKDGRPALAWRGRFFDAYGTWFVRFAPFEKPLGEAVVRWPAPMATTEPRRFEGYRLDAGGVPTFLLTVAGVRVEERYEAFAGGLRRSVQWNVEALRAVSVAHPDGVTVTEAAGSVPGKQTFIYTWP